MLQHLRSPGCRFALPALLAAACLAPRAAAQNTLVYGLNEMGKVCVNGTVLDSLGSSFEPDDTTPLNTEQRWWDLAVLGADRYALRLDGHLAKNGKTLYKLPFVLFANAPVWSGLAITPTKVYALRTDGLLSANGGDVQNYPEVNFGFVRCVGFDPDVYALRTDGSVFTNVSTDPLIKFTAGTGIGGAVDGQAHAQWLSFARNPQTGELFAMRLDGKIWKEDPATTGTLPFTGTSVVNLPFPGVVGDITNGTLYIALSFTADGTWRALRGDGAIFTNASALDPLIDLPGTDLGGTDETFFDVASSDTDFFGLRWDGRVFSSEGDQLFDMPGNRYRGLAFSAEAPDLTNFKNPPPVAATYKVRAIEGQATVLAPILVSDIEFLPADLIVTAPDTPPVGSVWDEKTRTLTWDNPGPVGTYTYTVTVSDGVNKPKKVKQIIKVLAADTDPLKNKKPIPVKIGTVQAQVGFPITFQVFAVDPDGDALTISVNDTKIPFTLGATFDDVTNTFTWTPSFDDIGKFTAKFKVTDGIKEVTLPVSIKVINPLIF